MRKPSQQSYRTLLPKVAQWVTGTSPRPPGWSGLSHHGVFYLPQPPSAGLWALSLSPTVAFLRALEGHQQTLAEHLWAIPQGTILNFQLAQ